MTIIRGPRKTENFTIISNDVCQNKALSMRALGLLVRLLSYPDHWSTNSEVLSREFDCGREQMRSVLKELVSAGYMRLDKSQNQAGHWSSQWVVSEGAIEPEADLPKDGKPGPGKPYAGPSGANTRTNLERTNTKAPDGFEDVYQAYPRKVGRPAAIKAWKAAKVKPSEVVTILEDIAKRKNEPEWTKDGGQFIPHPATYLNQRRWEDTGTTTAPTERQRYV